MSHSPALPLTSRVAGPARWPAAIALALLAVSAPACELDLSATADVCGDDGDCADGLTCQFGLCGAPGDNGLAPHVRVLPPSSSDLVEQQVPFVALRGGRAVVTELLAPSVVSGFVTRGAAAVNVPGTLTARTSGDIPGLDYRFSAPSHVGRSTEGKGFALALLPGRPYTVSFRPDQDVIPPHLESWTPDSLPDSGAAGERDIELPDAASIETVEGVVTLTGHGAVAGARVVGLLPSNEATAATTTDADGRFTLSVPPHAAWVRVHVRASTGAVGASGDLEQAPLFPDETFGPWSLADLAEGLVSQPLALELPDLGGIAPCEMAVRLLVPSADGAVTSPLSGVTLQLAGGFPSGTLRREATTDAEGIARFTALPAGYAGLAQSPASAAWATWLGTVNLACSLDGTEAAAPVDVEVARRQWLRGQVFSHAGATVGAGTLEAVRRAQSAADGALYLAEQAFTAALNLDGSFALLVDPGTYDLRVVPDVATNAPPAWVQDVVVVAGQSTGVDVDLPAPAVVHLVVRRPDPGGGGDSSVPLAQAAVELYLPVEAGGDEPPPPPLLVRGTTGSDGVVDLLVPFEP